jgi:hypothetical protein
LENIKIIACFSKGKERTMITIKRISIKFLFLLIVASLLSYFNSFVLSTKLVYWPGGTSLQYFSKQISAAPGYAHEFDFEHLRKV